jgi:hypothetical protein
VESIVFSHPRVEVSRPRVEVGLLVLVFGPVAPRSKRPSTRVQICMQAR